ncbi:hypothetical protein J5N97_012364 [Dioscorea zingiberensis]|uniref:GrpE protein homolog n=1 Tax=Dioscorea zingiberensis TaxID=325984 RepID=A0A9D5HHN6_9LILI|nr:hypothetical protein J5N97_012364 [Dioscorea zingiberensis]
MAAAASVSKHWLSVTTPLSPSSSRAPPKTLAFSFPSHQNPSRRRPKIQFVSSPIHRRCGISCPKVAKTINGENENQVEENKAGNNVDPNDLPPMKTLIQAYKKAILDGDEKSAYEVEAAICILENEKNDLSLKLSEMLAEITAGKEKLLRLKADFENFRRRSENDRLTFTSDVQGDVVENLLPIVDSFERAKQQIKPETEMEKKIDTSYQGIYKQFVEVMRNLRVAVVGTIGKPFDPSIHEAIGREESQEFREGIVIQELRRGFVLGERLLRPATVKVSTGPGPVKAPSDTEKSVEQPTETEQLADDPASTINTS